MMSYWIKFADGSEGCVECQFDSPEPFPERIERVKTLTEQQLGKPVASAEVIPYPAAPRLIMVKHPKYGACPSFCFQSRQCLGRTSCPRPYACDN
jgi:hypothetical protein